MAGGPDDEHAIACGGGRYRCTGCDHDTLNRWVAEAHYEEHHGEVEGADKPGWL